MWFIKKEQRNILSIGSDNFETENNFLVVILGPTAVGKTSIAIEVAKALNAEIISADSRQFYREMNIGTAKPSADLLSQVKHHFINSLSVKDNYNVAMFENDALKVLNKIFSFHKKIKEGKKAFVVMVGGSGLYINAVCNGFDSMPPSDAEVRANITEMYKREGIDSLRATLKKLDKEYYSQVDISNPHRMIRAIEVCIITGKPYSLFRKGKKKNRNFIPIKIGIILPRSELYERINVRVDEMMKNGLLQEAISLFRYRHMNSLNTVGYKEIFEYIDGTISLEKAVDLIKQNTRHFAKRQITWFKKDKEITWFSPYDTEKIIEFVLSMSLEKIRDSSI